MKGNFLVTILSLLLLCSICWNTQYIVWSFALIGIVSVHFLLTLGNKNSILEAIIFIAVCQWIAAPLISYRIFPEFAIMAVDELNYFQYLIPATTLFAIGILFPFKRIPISFIPIPNKTFVANVLMLIGLISLFVMPYLPVVIAGVVGNAKYLLYVGFFYSFFMIPERRRYVNLFILGILFYQVAKEGMFGMVLMWGFLFLNFYMLKKDWTFLKKTFLIVFSVIFFLPLQGTKMEYRRATWDGNKKEANPRLLIKNYLKLALNPTKLFDDEMLVYYNARMNQGAIVSKTLEHVPKSEPFARGETIGIAILGSLVPRLLWPTKPLSGGKVIYPRFTGNKLLGRTSINISPVAEVYVNFGRVGGAFCMLIFGLFINFIMLKCQNFAKRHPLFLMWIPMVFVSLIFLGTDFLSILNAIMKSLLFIFLCYWSMRFVFKINLF